MVLELALARERFKHRCPCLLGLQEHGIGAVDTLHQQDPSACPDATDADDLTCHVNQPECLEEVLAISRKTASVGAHQVYERKLEFSAPRSEKTSSIGTTRGGLLTIRGSPSTIVHKFGERLHAVPGPCLGDPGLSDFATLRSELVAVLGHDLVHVDAGVPDPEVRLLREVAHGFPVAARCQPTRFCCVVSS